MSPCLRPLAPATLDADGCSSVRRLIRSGRWRIRTFLTKYCTAGHHPAIARAPAPYRGRGIPRSGPPRGVEEGRGGSRRVDEGRGGSRRVEENEPCPA